MDITIEIDLGQVVRELNLSLESVQRTVALLDDGNTVPFITRYRKDQTGALDEEQIRRIQEKVGKLRGLVERKQTILRSLQSQGVLTSELADLIGHAPSLKRLEDLYLPFKPKKQTLATTARQRGLEPLAHEVLNADPAAADLRQRAEMLVDSAQELATADDVLQGVQHIIAELYSERAADVRGRLRKILQRTGKLVCSRVEAPKQGESPPNDTGGEAAGKASVEPEAELQEPVQAPVADAATDVHDEPTAALASDEVASGEVASGEVPSDEVASDEVASDEVASDEVASDEVASGEVPSGEVALTSEEPSREVVSGEEHIEGGDVALPRDDAAAAAAAADAAAADGAAPADATPSPAGDAEPAPADTPVATSSVAVTVPDDGPGSPAEGADREDGGNAEGPVADASVAGTSESGTVAPTVAPTVAAEGLETPAASVPDSPPLAMAAVKRSKSAEKGATKGAKKSKRGVMSKKEKKRQRLEAAFKDYYDFQESLSRTPPHRVLAINRGERARILRVKMEADAEAMAVEAESLLVPEDHPHREFLQGCIRDALHRLVLPSLDREVRREMTEKAEEHAVEVFARNLRKLLLQPPVHGRRVLAVDPGFRSGCKLIALDEFGNVLDHEIIHVIGKEEWIRKGRGKLIDLIRRHQLSAVAIGNGAACRETEQLVADVMDKELKDQDVAFVIVNEAGASVYSTSPLGREELPAYDAVLRSAISIGRRLLDPLSELVKINPANIGVGMYQHDVKAKHLRDSLDAVVESCVNYVGVDVNTASPALLRYVSGMNQLTARRLCEYRAKNGPFRNREQIKQVPGLGEATYVQAAGFLKISNGDNPLDTTWIHPESYELARKVLETAGCDVEYLRTKAMLAEAPVRRREFGQLEGEAQSDAVAADEAGTADAELIATQQPAELPPEPTPDPAVAESAVAESAVAESAVAESVTSDSVEPIAPVAETPLSAAGVEADTPDAPTPREGAAEPVGESTDEIREQAADASLGEPAADAEPVRDARPAPDAEAVAEAVAAAPESPSVELSAAESEVVAQRLRTLYDKVHQLEVSALANQWRVSDILLQDILELLARPGRDPREDLPPPVFRRGIVKLEDLEPGMQLSGTVLNVVDFGAFVDIGLTDSGLVHISRLADRFVRDPHEVVGVGDVLTVWVVEIDKKRRRVSLSAIEPGTERPAESRRRSDKPRSRKPAAQRPHAASGAQEGRGKGKGRPPHDKGYKPRPPRKPKVVTPITKDMEEGKEPLRSFSDLMQFYEKKQGDENESKS